MTPPRPDYRAVPGQDARRDPVRLLVLQGDEERPPVRAADEPVVMTFPHLLLRELIALLALSLFLVGLSLVFDAPLEEVANPEKTPNPAKAPWYFLGLQELLHYYPPLVAGVLLPGLVVLSLVVIPYFELNLERAPFWGPRGGARRGGAGRGGEGRGGLLPRRAGVVGWIARRSLAFWIFLWFLAVAVTLTAIGIFFRGPGWAFVLPWRDGIFY
jgi:menaquinol-cytochrome c reductase cytochrome b/c subunit